MINLMMLDVYEIIRDELKKGYCKCVTQGLDNDSSWI